MATNVINGGSCRLRRFVCLLISSLLINFTLGSGSLNGSITGNRSKIGEDGEILRGRLGLDCGLNILDLTGLVFVFDRRDLLFITYYDISTKLVFNIRDLGGLYKVLLITILLIILYETSDFLLLNGRLNGLFLTRDILVTYLRIDLYLFSFVLVILCTYASSCTLGSGITTYSIVGLSSKATYYDLATTEFACGARGLTLLSIGTCIIGDLRKARILTRVSCTRGGIVLRLGICFFLFGGIAR